MKNISLSYSQHREAVGNYLRRQDKKQGDQQSQNQRVKSLADHPGLHAGNQDMRNVLQAYVQMLSVLSAVQSSNVTFATTPERIEARTMENRIAQADAMFRYRRADQAMHREFRRQQGTQTQTRGTAGDQVVSGSRHDQFCWADPCPEDDSRPATEVMRSPDSVAAASVAIADRTDTGVLNGILDFPSRACAGAHEPVNQLSSWMGTHQALIGGVQATPVAPALSQQMKLVVLDETTARKFLTALIGGKDGKYMADEIRRLTAGKEMILAAMPQSRHDKRAALSTLNAYHDAIDQEYLRNNCQIRTKTVQGDPIGDTLLVAGEAMRNPWRAVTEAVNELADQGSSLSGTAETITEVINAASDVVFGLMTGWAYPIFKYATAKSLSVAGQATNGDMTCLKREFSPEEMARLLFDTETGITHHQPYPVFRHMPSELAGAGKFKPKGLFVEEHLPSGIQTEKYMSIQKDGVRVLIREKAPGEFFTYHPHAADPEQLEQRVHFDATTQRVFFDQDFTVGKGYEFNIIDGRKFIDVQGDRFELHYNAAKRRMEILVEEGDLSSMWPVYKEKISHTWHFDGHYDNPVFHDAHIAQIDNLKFTGDATHTYHLVKNQNPTGYGEGKIVEVRKAGALPAEAAELHVIEMHGELVPVRTHTTEGRGDRYEIYDTSAIEKRGHLVEWDGLRWVFERNTSVHVSPGLKKAVDPAMFDVSVSGLDLSAPDRRGLRWDRHNRGFLKIKGGFIRVRRYGYDPDAYYIVHAGKKINLMYDISRFRVEKVAHRLQRILTQGMSGRGAAHGVNGAGQGRDRTAVEIIQNSLGVTRAQAEAYMRDFNFDPDDFHNAMEFAELVQSIGAGSQWATAAQTNPSNMAPGVAVPVPGTSSGIAQSSGMAQGSGTIRNSDVGPNLGPPNVRRPVGRGMGKKTDQEGQVFLGAQIGETGNARFFRDANDSGYLIKHLKDRFIDGANRVHEESMARRISDADYEVNLFNHYYNAVRSKRIIVGNEVYIRMEQVPGKKLSEMTKGEMPDDGVERYADMLEHMNDVGVWNGQLQPGDLFFDLIGQKFYPVNFSISNRNYMQATALKRKRLDAQKANNWDRVVRVIKEKQRNPAP